MRALVAGIREADPDRLVFADGLNIGQTPVMEIVDVGVVQSTRGYLPKAVSHYTATWVPKEEFESFAVPTWPPKDDKGTTWDRERLKQVLIEPWLRLAEKGVILDSNRADVQYEDHNGPKLHRKMLELLRSH